MILITGSTGFIGEHLVRCLLSENRKFHALKRCSAQSDIENIHYVSYQDFFENNLMYQNVDTLIHLAGTAHKKFDPQEAHDSNYVLTKKIIDICIKRKIKKVIYLSTVNLYCTNKDKISVFSTLKNGEPPVLTTKKQAENYIITSCTNNLTDYVIIRSPLVYGEGVKANFASLMRFVDKGFPLPFRAIKINRRSLVSVYNLVNLITVCIEHPKATNQVFLVSDDNDLSTAEMVALMAKVQHKKNLALPVPVWCFKLAGKLFNKADVVDRLTGSLQLDITQTKNILDWTPPYSVEHGFRLAAKTPSIK